MKKEIVTGKFASICAVIGCLISSSALSAQVDLLPSKIEKDVILDIANKSNIKELNRLLGDRSANVALRLFEIPEDGDCVRETHVTCSNRYYLGVIEIGELPAQALFSLGRVGEIADINWTETKMEGAVLEFSVLNYPSSALRANSKLKKTTKKYRATIRMKQTEKPPFTYELILKSE